MICRGRSTLIYCRAFNKYIVIYFCTWACHFSSWNLRSAKFTATSNLALYFVINDIYDTLMNARSIVHICFTSRLINTRHRCGVSVFRGRWIGLWGGFRCRYKASIMPGTIWHRGGERAGVEYLSTTRKERCTERYLPAGEMSL